MKKLIITVFAILMAAFVFVQTDYQWKIKNDVNKTQ